MSDFEKEFLDSKEKLSHFSQAGLLKDSSLTQLREQIKKVMLPLLIKIFQLKLELSQSLSVPSRLSQKNPLTPEEIIDQLKALDNDLKVLVLWCQSSRSQIQKALSISEEEQKKPISSSLSLEPNSAVAKSFNEAISAEDSFFHKENYAAASSHKTWWNKFLE